MSCKLFFAENTRGGGYYPEVNFEVLEVVHA